MDNDGINNRTAVVNHPFLSANIHTIRRPPGLHPSTNHHGSRQPAPQSIRMTCPRTLSQLRAKVHAHSIHASETRDGFDSTVGVVSVPVVQNVFESVELCDFSSQEILIDG